MIRIDSSRAAMTAGDWSPEAADLPGASPAAAENSQVDKSGERVRAMFGQIAPRYDLMNHVLSGGVDAWWRWYTVRKVMNEYDGPVLDACTGTGDLAIAFWKYRRRAMRVVGTDFTPEMLEIARDKATRMAGDVPQTLTFQQADTQELPFADGEFGVVSVAFGLRNVADTARGLRELLRVTRPGGVVAVLEFSIPGNAVLRAGYLWYFKHILPRIGQFFARNQSAAYEYLPASVSEFPYGAALAAQMSAAGMERVRFIPLTGGIASLYLGEKPGGASRDVAESGAGAGG